MILGFFQSFQAWGSAITGWSIWASSEPQLSSKNFQVEFPDLAFYRNVAPFSGCLLCSFDLRWHPGKQIPSRNSDSVFYWHSRERPITVGRCHRVELPTPPAPRFVVWCIQAEGDRSRTHHRVDWHLLALKIRTLHIAPTTDKRAKWHFLKKWAITAKTYSVSQIFLCTWLIWS